MVELPRVAVGVIAGSGMDELAGLEDAHEVAVETPFGAPSAPFVVGRLGQTEVAFLARHGAGHVRLPSELNHRANIFALKLLGAERIISASAVGSMREEIHPRQVVLVDQFIDRTAHRPATFFGNGIAAHISFAEPVCGSLRGWLTDVCRRVDPAMVHERGTYVCIEGPAFSTRAESNLYRSWKVDVIGMTNLQEAKLAREAEICYATLAFVTDYDCWHDSEDDVSVEALLGNLRANQQAAGRILHDAIGGIRPRTGGCGCGSALASAIITARDAIGDQTRERLRPIVGRYLDS